MNYNSYQKKCPECGETYIGQRLNQIYCSSSCKARFNNRKAREEEEHLRKIRKITAPKNQVLWNNRQVLKEYVGQEVEKSTLKSKDFKLKYMTDFYKSKAGNNVFVLYDFAYYFIDDQTIKIFAL